MNALIPVITVDGFSGVGKGALCKKLSEILKWNFLDSGMLYRIFTLFALENKIPLDQEIELVKFAKHFNKIFFLFGLKLFNLILGRADILNLIRKEYIGFFTSKIFMFPGLRKEFLLVQRNFRKFPGLIADGRDMGTVVFPDACVKIFLHASLKARVKRRMLQMKKIGMCYDLSTLSSQMNIRDGFDRNRQISPTKPADDALVIDSTFLNKKEVIKTVLNYMKISFFHKKYFLIKEIIR